MAPVNNGSARRGRGNVNTGRSRRNAYTTAGVNRGRSNAPDGSTRARGAHHRRANTHRTHSTPARPSLASRITYGGASPQDQTRGTSHYQSPDGNENIGVGIHEHAASATLVNSHDVGQAEHNTASTRRANMSDLDMDEDVDIDIDIDDMLFNNQQHHSYSQQSALFCGSQPTQPTEPLPPLAPPDPRPPSIRMLNEPPAAPTPANTTPTGIPRRPVNTYRGKDPIKRLVQNKKLQAIFADRPVPKERKKPLDERMELRMGMNSVMK